MEITPEMIEWLLGKPLETNQKFGTELEEVLSQIAEALLPSQKAALHNRRPRHIVTHDCTRSLMDKTLEADNGPHSRHLPTC